MAIRSARAVANSYARRKRRRRNGGYRLEKNYVEFTHLTGTNGLSNVDATTPFKTDLQVQPLLVNLNADAGQLDTPSNLCNIPRGTSVNTRVGRRVWAQSIQVSGLMRYDCSNTQQGSVVFNLALCCYKDCDKRKPTTGDIFEDYYPPMRKIEHMSDYRVIKLWKKTVKTDVELNAGTYVGYSEVPFSVYKRVNMMIEFTPGSETPIKSSDIEKNHLFFVAWVSNNNGTASLNFKVRMRYIDM